MILRMWGWLREQQYPLESTLRQRTVDLRQRYRARRDERRPWKEAEGLADLGELTAQWAEGTVKYHPGGYDEGPAEETLEIAPALATLNRAGFVTSGSQPGWIGPSGWGWDVHQRAVVEGFTNSYTADRIEAACADTDLIFIRNGPARWRSSWKNGVLCTATPIDGDRITDDSVCIGHTGFGGHMSRRRINFEFDGFGFDALRDAEQITVIDPVWGRKDHLWDTLTAALAPPCCPCRGDHDVG